MWFMVHLVVCGGHRRSRPINHTTNKHHVPPYQDPGLSDPDIPRTIINRILDSMLMIAAVVQVSKPVLNSRHEDSAPVQPLCSISTNRTNGGWWLCLTCRVFKTPGYTVYAANIMWFSIVTEIETNMCAAYYECSPGQVTRDPTECVRVHQQSKIEDISSCGGTRACVGYRVTWA